MKFKFAKLLKQTRPGNAGFCMQLEAYPPDRRLCAVTYVKEYLRRTEELRKKERQLFLTFKRPHKAASSQSISRWIRSALAEAGIDTHTFKSHSTREASTSAALRLKVPIEDILAKAGWASEKNFQKFYKKPLQKEGLFSKAFTCLLNC